MSTGALVAEGLCRRYGATRALDGFDLPVPAGSVCGPLGLSGAGKTTAVRVLATLTRPDPERATVACADVRTEADAVRNRSDLVGQIAALDEQLTGRETLPVAATGMAQERR